MDVRRLAYQLAVSNGIEHRFSEIMQQAGRKWLKSFLQRHPRLTVRKPTGTAIARALGFTKENVDRFFDLLETRMDEYNYPSDRVFNTDETGLSIVQSRCSEVISLKGKEVISLKGKRQPSKEDPVLLILDGHNSHTRNLEFLKLAKANYVTVLSLPPHTSHKMQPLDKSVMGPLKTFYSEEIRKFMRQHQRAVTHFDIAEVFGKAYLKVQNGVYAKNGFEATGLYPVNRHIFDQSEFLSAEQQHEQEQILENTSSNTNTNRPVYVSPKDLMPVPTLKKKVGCRELETSINADKKLKATRNLAKLAKDNKTKIKSNVISDKKLKATRNLAKNNKTKNKNNVIRDVDEAGPSDLTVSKRQQRKRLPSNSSDESNEALELQDSSDDDLPIKLPTKSPDVDAACMFCHRNFSEDMTGEIWIQCILCHFWAPEDCSGAISEHFVCEFCK
ncbi:DDE superfamily endonuclease [Popillia japonica]|uniref:DDE superfamily endonuclease n=1 Tax=Popillia japonica TaxID=7064 RepID=A0AAW1HTG3_POPJA